MDLPSGPARSSAVTAAGVVALICSGLTILLAVFGFFGVAVLDQAQQQQQRPDLTPEQFRVVGFVGVLFIALLGAWGLSTAVGLFRYRNWARISTLVWSGLTAIFGTLVLLLMSTVKFPAAPGVPSGFDSSVRVFIMTFYAIPVGIAIWWLVLFTRKPIVAMFGGAPGATVSADDRLDASGFPATPPPRRVPLPVSVVAWFCIISAAIAVLFLLWQPPTAVLFGHLVKGPEIKLLFLANCLAYAVGGIGLLKLKSWSFWLMVVIQTFWLLSGTISLLNPNYESLMRQVQASSRFGPSQAAPPWNYRTFGVFTLAFVLIPVIVLLAYRIRFLGSSENQDTSAN